MYLSVNITPIHTKKISRVLGLLADPSERGANRPRSVTSASHRLIPARSYGLPQGSSGPVKLRSGEKSARIAVDSTDFVPDFIAALAPGSGGAGSSEKP